MVSVCWTLNDWHLATVTRLLWHWTDFGSLPKFNFIKSEMETHNILQQLMMICLRSQFNFEISLFLRNINQFHLQFRWNEANAIKPMISLYFETVTNILNLGRIFNYNYSCQHQVKSSEKKFLINLSICICMFREWKFSLSAQMHAKTLVRMCAHWINYLQI